MYKRQFLPDYPEALEAILMRVLAERPDDRPRTALELRQQLFKAVSPASDDDVANFLAELFSGRRLERDERLRLALDSRPEPVAAKSQGEPERRDGERSNARRGPRKDAVPSRSRALGFAIAGAAILALAALASGTQLNGEHGGGRPLGLDAKRAPAAAEPPSATKPPPSVAAKSSPALAARSEPQTLESEASGERTPRVERRAIDLSPVREVGF